MSFLTKSKGFKLLGGRFLLRFSTLLTKNEFMIPDKLEGLEWRVPLSRSFVGGPPDDQPNQDLMCFQVDLLSEEYSDHIKHKISSVLIYYPLDLVIAGRIIDISREYT